MGIAQTINLEEADTFAAPEHLVPHFNSGEINYEQLAVLSAKYYLNESNEATEKLNAITLKNEALQGLVADSATEKAALNAKLTEFQNQELALAMARKELSEQQTRILAADAVEAANTTLAKRVQVLESEATANALRLKQLDALETELSELTVAHIELTNANNELKGKNSVLNSLSVAHETGTKDLRNAVATGNKKIEALNETIAQLKNEIKGEQEISNELRKTAKDGIDSISEAKTAVNTIAATILRLDKNQKALDKENRQLSLYINAHTTAPMLELPTGHQLKALMFDKDQIVSSDGKEVIKDNTALFQWVNPNGFSCLVALGSKKDAKGNNTDLLLLPSLVDEKIAGKLTPTGKKVAKSLTDAIAPPKEHYDLIIKHIKDFKVTDFKKAMLRAFARATYIANETNHLTLEAEEGLTQGDIKAMREMSLSHDKLLTRTLARSKAAQRPRVNPNKKQTKSKKRR